VSGRFQGAATTMTEQAILGVHAMTKRTSEKPASTAAKSKGKQTAPKAGKADAPKLLSGGNPQIPKGDGDAPVQAYIAAMPGWKHDVGRRLDELIVATVPDVQKAVRWNTPFYGLADQGWFVTFHCFEKYLKVTFFRGTSLRPVPPVESKTPETRYVHIYEDDTLDEAQLVSWVEQASQLPGERL